MTAAIALFAFGAVTAALSLGLPLGTLRAPGSGFFPLVLAFALMALAAGEAVRARRTHVRAAAAPAPEGATRRVLFFMGAVALATALLSTLGYALVSFLLMLALLRTLGMRDWRVTGSIALVTAAASQVLFVHWLRIPLPGGWLPL